MVRDTVSVRLRRERRNRVLQMERREREVERGVAARK